MGISAGGVVPLTELAIAAGLVPGLSRLSFVGHNLDIDTLTTPETIWEAGGLYPWMPVPNFLEVISTSANDTLLGTGLRTAQITGLDANFNVISEIIALNGLSVRATTQAYRRVNQFVSITAGSGELNAGDITLRIGGGGATQGQISAGDGLAHTGVQTVPANFTYFIVSVFASVFKAGATDAVQLALRFRDGTVPNSAWNEFLEFGLTVTGTSDSFTPAMPFSIPQKSDIEALCELATSNNMAVSIAFQGVLVANRFLPAP